MDVSTRLTAGDLVLDQDSREAFLRGVPLKLTRLEFEVLAHLLRHQNRAVYRQELLDEVWGEGYSPESNVVDVVVGSLRRKLGDDRRRPRYIVTVPGVGYRMRGPAAASRSRRWLLYSSPVLALVGAGIIAWLLVAFGVFGSGGGDADTAGVTGDAESGEIVLVVEMRSTSSPPLTGDCQSEDRTVSGWKSAGSMSGNLNGTAETDLGGRLFYTAGCLAGAAKGTMVLVDTSGDRLEMIIDRIFSVVQLRPPPAPAAMEGSDVLTVVGGTGRFANTNGYGTCQTTELLEYNEAPLSLNSASRSHCRLTLSDAGASSAWASLSVRLVANPTQVSLVGAPDPSKSAATYALVLYRNEGQRDLSNLTLTLLPVEGVSMNAKSRTVEGEAAPPIRTWRLPDLRAGERQAFDFSVQFESADRPEVPLVVRLSSPDMETPVQSDPFTIEIE
jgi:DNA-binding winged helix-turn-helix (wHTH) protein